MLTSYRAAQVVAIALMVTVVTQLIYVVGGSAGIAINSTAVWTIEALAFLSVAIFALATMGGGAPTVAAALAVGGLLNVIQVGMGLAMFGPLREAGEAAAPAMQAVVAGAFFLYFAGKFAFGVAALLLGITLLRSGPTLAKTIGGLAALAGLAAMALETAAMAIGMDLVFPAGAAGTAAAFFAALCFPNAVHGSPRDRSGLAGL